MDVGSIDLSCYENSQIALTCMPGHETRPVALFFFYDSLILLSNWVPASQSTLIRFYIMSCLTIRLASLDHWLTCTFARCMIIAPKNPFSLSRVLRQCLTGSVCYHSGFVSTLWLQCIEMRLFDELSRCVPWTTQTNIYSRNERWQKGS